MHDMVFYKYHDMIPLTHKHTACTGTKNLTLPYITMLLNSYYIIKYILILLLMFSQQLPVLYTLNEWFADFKNLL